MVDYSLLFTDFKNREEDLRKITRYQNYSVMFYRTNLFTHSKRVAWLVQEMIPFAQATWQDFDGKKAKLLALVHDDQEIIMGDIPAGNKSKMTTEQLAEIAKIEEKAIELIAKKFPTMLATYHYQELLEEIASSTTKEAWIVKYADKMDAFGEALHEVFAGNKIFEINVINEYGTIPTPTEYYLDYFESILKSFPGMSEVLQTDFPLFKTPLRKPFKNFVQNYSPHTAESIYQDYNYLHYDTWKKIILSQADQEELQNLYVQKEPL